jgi:hypothetical protein
MELEHKCILSWMETEANGVKNARKRKDILPYVSHQLDCNGGQEAQDRRLRQILSDLKHQGLIGSNCDKGYWSIRLDNIEDIEAALSSVKEMEAKALSMLEDSSKLKAKFDGAKQVVDNGQMTLGG